MKWSLITVFLVLFFISFTSAYNFGNYVYDDFDDASINFNLWQWKNITGTSTLTESGGHMQLIISTSGTFNANVSSLQIPELNLLDNLTIRAYIQGSVVGSGSASECARANFYVFGTVVNTVERCATTGSTTDDSVYTILRNESKGINAISVYNDGVHVSTYNITNNIINQRVYTSGIGGETYTSTARLYYVNYTGYQSSISFLDVSPNNNSETLSNEVEFFVNVSSSNSLVNATLYINGVLNESKSFTGTLNSTSFSKTLLKGDYNYSVLVCDSGSLVECKSTGDYNFRVGSYIIDSFNYTTPTIEGSLDTFTLDLSLASGITVTNAFLNYNGTSYTSNVATGTGFANITSTIQIPDFDSDVNVSFSFNITLSDGTNFLSSGIQEVLNLAVDNCAVNTFNIFNTSLFDERLLTPINGTVEFTLDLLNSDFSQVATLSTNVTGDSTYSFCSNINVVSSSYLYDLELRYYSSSDGGVTYDYVPEFYHIQRAEASSLPQNINLYDLNANESTEFTIFYRDNSYNPRPNALLMIQRKYINEGLYRTVEIPITSSEGEAIGHFDTNNYKYRIIVTQYGEVLNTFDNPTIACESELTGICEIVLNGQASPPQAQGTATIQNFVYTATQDNDTLTVTYTIPTGESEVVSIEMIQTSAFSDPITICSQSILSSSGSLECTVNPSIGDSQVIIRITKGGSLVAQLTAIYEEDLGTFFALNNYFIAGVMLITLVMMFISSPALMIVASMFGILYLGVVFLIKGSSILMITGVMSWLLLAGIIVLVKLNKKDEA